MLSLCREGAFVDVIRTRTFSTEYKEMKDREYRLLYMSHHELSLNNQSPTKEKFTHDLVSYKYVLRKLTC